MTVEIIDANNFYRKWIETDSSGRPPRSLANKINARQDPDPIIFVWDGVNANARRRQIFPNYKVGRNKPTTDIFAAFEFLREKVLPHTKAIQVRIPEYEADDVVATLALSQAKYGKNIRVVSNDFDLKQLEQVPLIKVDAKDKEGVPPNLVHLYKTWVGDPSDAIPGVKGFGKQSWDHANKVELQEITDIILYDYDLFWESEFNVLSVASRRWLEKNRSTFEAMWNVTALQLVDENLIAKSLRFGREDLAKQNEVLERFFL